jgi:CRISPR/Cas system-associated protein Cas7 (RAMP superfamily)
MKAFKFKPWNKIVHKETKEVKKIYQINASEGVYCFEQEGTKTLEKVAQETIDEEYELYKLSDIWNGL